MAEEQIARHERGPVEGLDPSSFKAPPRTSEAGRAGALHICPCCDSELVYPLDWKPVAQKRWSVDLRCPDCEWLGGGIYRQEVVDRFDEALDRGTEQVLADLSLLARANMEDQVRRFTAALWAGDVLPEDF
jgi:hypothetical protein